MALQEFLASFGVEVDEAGVGRLQDVLKENKTLAEDLAKAFSNARASLKPLLTTTATEALNSLKTSGALNLRLTADASAVVATANTALATIKAAYSGTTLQLSARVTTVGSDGSGQNGGVTSRASGIMASTGGRFTRRTSVEVAEDGQAEYIIPMGKEGIAVPLLRQLFSELSDTAKESIVGKMPSPSAVLAGAQSAAAGSGSTSYVQAPVNITVNASGGQAEAVGRSVYNLADRYLVRTLKGAKA